MLTYSKHEGGGLSIEILRLCQFLFARPMPYTLLHAYFDESGKFHDKDVISFCGWITPFQGWEALVGEWNVLLQKYQLPYLRMSSLMNYRDEFSHLKRAWGDDKREVVLLEFAELIRKHAGFGIGAALDAKHFRGLPQALTAQESSLKTELLNLMHKSGKTHYKHGTVEIDVVPEGEKVKVRIKDENEQKPDDTQPEAAPDAESEEYLDDAVADEEADPVEVEA